MPRVLILILLLAGTLRVGWAMAQPTSPAAIDRLPDQREYLSLGRSLLDGRGLQLFDPRFGQTVLAYRMPGYPALIAACGGLPRVVRVVQAVADTSTILAVFLLAVRMGAPESAALAAAVIVAADPFLIYFDGLLLSESLFTTLLAWGTLLAVGRRPWASSVAVTAGVLVRPSALLLVPLLVAAGSWVGEQNPPSAKAYPWKRSLAAGLMAGVVLLLSLFPWAWRNDRLLGRWVWTTTNGGITLYDGFHPAATGASDQRFLTDDPGLRPIMQEGEVQRSADLQHRARAWMREHPARLPVLTLRKIGRTWSPIPLSGEFGRPLYVVVSAAFAVPFDLLVLVGLFGTGLSRRAKWVLVLPALYFTAVHAMSVGSLRYRVPVEPVLAVVAGVGAVRVLTPAPSGRGGQNRHAVDSTFAHRMPSVLCNPDRPLDRLWRRGKPFQPKCGALRRWGMLLCLVFLGNVVVVYWFMTDPVRVRKMAEAYLSDLTGGQVTVGSASLSLFDGLTLSHVTVKVIDADPSAPVVLSTNTAAAPDAVLLEADAFDVAYDPPSLLRGRLAAARIVAVGLHVHLIEDVDNHRWNYQRMGAANWPRQKPHAPKVNKPPRRIDLPQIILRDAQVQYGELRGNQLTQGGTLSLEGRLSPEASNQQYAFELTSRGSVDSAGAVLAGDVSLTTGTVNAALSNLQFGQDLQAMLPDQVRQWWADHRLQGQLDVPEFHYTPAHGAKPADFRIASRLDHTKLVIPFRELASGDAADRLAARQALFTMLTGAGFDLAGTISRVSALTTPDPIEVQDVSGTFRFDPRGIALDHVLCRIEGNLLAASGQFDGYSPDAPAHLRLESLPSEPIHIEQNLPFASSLPEQALQIYNMIRPYGTGSLWMEFDRPTPRAAPRISGEIHVADGGYVCKFYPYPVSRAQGTVAFAHDAASDTDRVELRNIVGYGIGGGPNERSPVTLNGWVGPFDRRVGCGIHIVADDITSEPALLASLPPDVRTAVDSAWRRAPASPARSATPPAAPAHADAPLDLTMHGTIRCDVNMPIGIGTKPSISTDLSLDDVNGTLAAFPYPLHHLSGELHVRDTFFDLVNAKMKTPAGAAIAASGRVSWRLDERNDVQNIQPALHLAATDLPIDADLLAALSPEQQQWFHQAGLTGVLDVNGDVTAAPVSMTPPAVNHADATAGLAYDLAIGLRHGVVAPPRRGEVVRDLTGSFRLTPDQLLVSQLTGRRGMATVSVAGSLLMPDGVPPSLHLGAQVDGLALDPGLHALLPTAARQEWDALAPTGQIDAGLDYHGPVAALVDAATEPASGGTATTSTATDSTRYTLTLHPHGLNVTPAFFPYPLAATAGTVTLTPAGVTLTDCVAHHGPATLQLSATNSNAAPADWNATLTASDVPLDADLLRALPPGVSDAIKRSEAHGSVSMRVTQLRYHDRSTPGKPNAPGDLLAAGVLRTDALVLDPGAPVTEVAGGLGFSLSMRNGSLDALHGKLAIDHLSLAQRPVDNLKADLEKPAGVNTLKISNVEGTVADGRFGGSATVQFAPAAPANYSLDMVMKNADVGTVAGRGDEIRGQLSASLSMEGKWNDVASRRGRGDVLVSGQSMYQIPLLLGLWDVTNLSLPATSPFSEGTARYNVDGKRVTFEQIQMRSEALVMNGNGFLDFGSKQVRLNFSTDNPNMPKLPFVHDLWQGASQELLRIQIRGTVQDPKVSAAPLHTMTTTVDQVLSGSGKEN